MKRTYDKKNVFCPIVAVVLSAALTICILSEYFIKTRKLQSECLRLHIIAASDSEEDQRVKLEVRDALLSSAAEIFNGEINAAAALSKINPFIPELENIANRVLKKNNCDYKAKITVVNEYFDTRQYEDITFPAGKYTAFKVTLGLGGGKNWWCIMFPPLCLPAVTGDREDELYAVFGEDGTQILKGKKEYRLRFKIVEIIEKIIKKVNCG